MQLRSQRYLISSRWQIIAVNLCCLAIIVLYVKSLTMDALGGPGFNTVKYAIYPGYYILFFGLFGNPVAWFANVLLAITILLHLFSLFRLAFYSALLGATCSLAAFYSVGGIKLTFYNGAYLWLLSMALLVCVSMFSHRLLRPIKK